MIHKATLDKAFPVYDEGLKVCDWLYVKNHSYGILAVIEKGSIVEIISWMNTMFKDDIVSYAIVGGVLVKVI